MARLSQAKPSVPRGTIHSSIAGAFIFGLVAGLAWATIVQAHYHDQAIAAQPRPCNRTIHVEHGVVRDFGCHNGNWRYGHKREKRDSQKK